MDIAGPSRIEMGDQDVGTARALTYFLRRRSASRVAYSAGRAAVSFGRPSASFEAITSSSVIARMVRSPKASLTVATSS
jgi:hypothetical protein